MELQQDIKHACQEVLNRAYKIGSFTQREFGWLDEVIQWFDNPTEDISFSFSISQENNGESIIYSIEYDGHALQVNETSTSYDPNIGSDHFTSYDYLQSPNERREEGGISNWKNGALNTLQLSQDITARVELTISLNEN